MLGIINFAHGSFYMLGAYFALTAYKLTGSFFVALVAGSLGAGIFGVIFERLFISRVYGRDLLMQLLVCYAMTLILDDGVKLVYGADYQMMGMPEVFVGTAGADRWRLRPCLLPLHGRDRASWPGLFYGSASTGPGLARPSGRWRSIRRWWVSWREHHAALCRRLRRRQPARRAGRRVGGADPHADAGHGFSFLIDSFIVTVIGGMGSIAGAFIAALLIGFIRAFGAIGFPWFVDGLMFAIMALVLVVKPTGLLGRAAS